MLIVVPLPRPFQSPKTVVAELGPKPMVALDPEIPKSVIEGVSIYKVLDTLDMDTLIKKLPPKAETVEELLLLPKLKLVQFPEVPMLMDVAAFAILNAAAGETMSPPFISISPATVRVSVVLLYVSPASPPNDPESLN